MSNEETFNERWNDMVELLRSVYGKQEGFEKNLEALGEDSRRLFRLAQAVPVDRDFSLTAHRWFHTVGSSQINFLTLLVGLLNPSLITEATFKIAEDLFHLGFLAGHAASKGLMGDEIVSVDDVAPCLAEGSGGVESVDGMLERLSPEHVNELRAFVALTAGMREAAMKAPPQEEGYFPE